MTGYIILLSFLVLFNPADFRLPIQSYDIKSWESIQITEIGDFGEKRKERPGIPGHYHTGIDIMRLGDFENINRIYAITDGVVISKRTDGPYAQLIIEHEFSGDYLWTVYEHISGITVELNQQVDTQTPIARFFNKDELDAYGWQFNHFHFEILKVPPLHIQPDQKNPSRLFNSYTLSCYEIQELNKNFFNPIEFFKKKL